MQHDKAAHAKILSACVLASVCLLSPAIAADADEQKLENLLDKIDQPQDFPAPPKETSGTPAGAYPGAQPPGGYDGAQAGGAWRRPSYTYGPAGPQAYQAPPATPTSQVFTRPCAPAAAQMNYSIPALAALKNSALWRNIQQQGYGGAGAGMPGGNPFNLSPFGMLHYMWDDTTYTSSANPVTLYQVQNDLQYARQQSQLAQAAAQRARYAQTPQERAEAAQQAQFYASEAQAAAQRAQEESDAGSLNPTEVARAVAEQAANAQSYARQARSTAAQGF